MSEPSNLISEPVAGIDPKYGGLIKGGEAKKTQAELVHKPKHHPRGRPAMTGDVEAKWDAHQAKTRTINVRIHCTPPARKDNGEGFGGYWCAKRFWPAGGGLYKVSPHELLELESEPNVFQVELQSERIRAYSIPALIGEFSKQAKAEADLNEKLMNGELTDAELATLKADHHKAEGKSETKQDASTPATLSEPEKTAPEAHQAAQGLSQKTFKK